MKFLNSIEDATKIVTDANHRFMTDAEKTKLVNIEDNANNYTHPSTHSADIIVDGTNNKVFTAAEKAKLAGLADYTEIININANTTLDLSHAQKFLKCTNSITITIPTNTNVAFPIGTEIEICRYGEGSVNVAGASGVTVNSKDGNMYISAPYANAALKKLASNEWLLVGDLSDS
jgi:hypothetical protein